MMVSSWSISCFQSTLIRWRRSLTRRRLSMGSTHTKIEQLPWLTYSESCFKSCLGQFGDRVAGVPEELIRLLVQTHHRHRRIERAVVTIPQVSHTSHQLAASVRRDPSSNSLDDGEAPYWALVKHLCFLSCHCAAVERRAHVADSEHG